MIVSDEHQYVFIQYPHSGSTAVGAELVENYNGREILEKHSTFADLKFECPALAQNCFVFTGIRHPLDDAVAMYWKLATRDKYTNPENWARHGGFVSERGVRKAKAVRDGLSFADYLRRYYYLPYCDWSVYTHPRADFVLRKESLDEDFARAIERMGLELKRPLPEANVSRERPPYPEWYGSDIRPWARSIFGPFMKFHGYDFPDAWENGRVPLWSRFVFEMERAVFEATGRSEALRSMRETLRRRLLP